MSGSLRVQFGAGGRLLVLLAIALLALAGCEDTAVHTTPPAPLESEDAPTVTVNPATLGPAMPVTVTGSGFPPNTVVELHVSPETAGFAADPLGEGQTDASGQVTIDARLPALWLDGTPLAGPELRLELVTEDGDIRGVVVAPFEAEELENFLTIDMPSGAVGQQVQLRGQGFEPGRELTVRLAAAAESLSADGLDEMVLATETVADDGSFEALITIPETWSDGDAITEESIIIALVDEADGEIVATAGFTNVQEQAE